MKALRAMMLVSVCALTTAGATTAPLLDVERGDTNMIVAGTSPALPKPDIVAVANVVESPANNDIAPDAAVIVVEAPSTTTTTTLKTTTTGTTTTGTTTETTTTVGTTTTVESTETASTTTVEPTAVQDAPIASSTGQTP